jgi:hypothetical protein
MVKALDAPRVTIASPYGGLLYFEGTGKRSSMHVNVTGVIRCPWFDTTIMADSDWPVLQAHPGPWGELLGKHIIITMPSKCMRLIDNPRAVLAYWDSVVASHFDLVFQSPPVPPGRRERIVADIQISAGYMHSGYPVRKYEGSWSVLFFVCDSFRLDFDHQVSSFFSAPGHNAGHK